MAPRAAGRERVSSGRRFLRTSWLERRAHMRRPMPAALRPARALRQAAGKARAQSSAIAATSR